MRWVQWVVAVLLVGLRGAPALAAGGPEPAQAVVKVYVTAMTPDVAAPWRPGTNESRTGSGAVIEGGRILTAAHVVEGATFVEVRLNGTAGGARARIAFVSHVADLALLEVDAPGFFARVSPLALGGLPAVQRQVRAYGFPNGGETLSVTTGVVARVEHERYLQGGEDLLAFQMDAAIAPGSSGGPVVEDGRLVGVAVQGFKDSGFGSAVPAPVIRQFLDDVADGRLDGVPRLGVGLQKIMSAALRESLRVPPEEAGALVRAAFPGAGANVLREGDVLLSIGGHAIGADGTIEFRPRERTDLSYVTDLLQVGDAVPVRYLREGQLQEAEIRLHQARGERDLVPRIFDRGADYYLFGGLGFVTLTRNLLDLAKPFAPPRIAALAGGERLRDGEEVVLLLDVLRGDVNAGYGEELFEVVEDVNGQEVSSLRELVQAVEGCADRFVSFGLSAGYRVTVDREEALTSAPELLERYGVSADRSARLAKAVREAPGRARQLSEVAVAAGPQEVVR